MNMNLKFKLMECLFMAFLLSLVSACGGDDGRYDEPDYPYEEEDSSKPDNDDDEEENAESASTKNLIGIWFFSEYPHQYWHLLSDGNGYCQSNATAKDESVYRRAFKWLYSGKVLSLNYGTYEDKYEIKFEKENQISIKNLRNGNISKLKRTSKDGTTKVNYKAPPFDCYIVSNSNPYLYYPLYSAIERVQHASGGSSANSLSLTFLGSNKEVSPNGGFIEYCTPYYEGIPSSWSNGTYSISESKGFWVVRASYMYVAKSNLGGGEGTLKVNKSGSKKIYDVKTDYVTIHFNGK